MPFTGDRRIKKQKISQNVVYSKNCISLNPISAIIIFAQLIAKCE
jgi:hypothetical protein